jgi:hypothetical protein
MEQAIRTAITTAAVVRLTSKLPPSKLTNSLAFYRTIGEEVYRLDVACWEILESPLNEGNID